MGVAACRYRPIPLPAATIGGTPKNNPPIYILSQYLEHLPHQRFYGCFKESSFGLAPRRKQLIENGSPDSETVARQFGMGLTRQVKCGTESLIYLDIPERDTSHDPTHNPAPQRHDIRRRRRAALSPPTSSSRADRISAIGDLRDQLRRPHHRPRRTRRPPPASSTCSAGRPNP